MDPNNEDYDGQSEIKGDVLFMKQIKERHEAVLNLDGQACNFLCPWTHIFSLGIKIAKVGALTS